MASFIDSVRQGVVKALSQTNPTYNQFLYQWLGSSIVWNPENDATYIHDGYQQNATVYSIVNLIAKAASVVPFQIYEVKNVSEAKKYKAMTSSFMDGNTILKSNIIRKQAYEVVDVPALEQLLNRPNEDQSYASFITNLIAFGKLTGNRYIWGLGPDNGPNAGKVTEMYVLPSHLIEIVANGYQEPIAGYKLQYNAGQTIPPEQVCHIKDFNPEYDSAGSNLYGQSPLRAGFRVLTMNNDATISGVKYLQNQTARGMLVDKSGYQNAIQSKQLKDQFKKQYQGTNNSGDVIITNQDLQWVNFGLSAADVALIEQYNASVKDICNIYNIPVQLLNNTDSSSYNNMKEAKKAMYQNAVIPELIKIRDELNRWLVPQFGDNLYLDFDFTVIGELQEDVDKLVSQMASAWWLTPNEKREAMNYGRDMDNATMDDYYIPANLQPSSITIDSIEMPKSFDIDFSTFKPKTEQ
jgi:HK97 family phage portal protein